MTPYPTTQKIVTQQWKAFKPIDVHAKPRDYFLHNLELFLLDLQLQDHEILLDLDANLQQLVHLPFVNFP